jgi:hypothetical protein
MPWLWSLLSPRPSGASDTAGIVGKAGGLMYLKLSLSSSTVQYQTRDSIPTGGAGL